jgi:hypothetical protein
MHNLGLIKEEVCQLCIFLEFLHTRGSFATHPVELEDHIDLLVLSRIACVRRDWLLPHRIFRKLAGALTYARQTPLHG